MSLSTLIGSRAATRASVHPRLHLALSANARRRADTRVLVQQCLRQKLRLGIHRTDQTVFHHPGVEKRPDEFEHTLIGHSRGDARHQAVVIDSVERRHHRLPIPKTFRLQWSSPAGGIPSRDAASP